ncbi:MAG: hypothetical protein KC516_02210 [Nanoarchaeota archaeon]|nr:hypothetical protein [Nanoarchaeota archaeon]
MQLEPIIQEELNKLQLPNAKITLRTYSEVYPHSDKNTDSYFIQISIDSNLEDSTHDCSCSYLDFWYNSEDQRIEHINFSLKENLKGKGFGRELVETMEKIGKRLDCKTSRVCLNTNYSFWNHMGYEQEQSYWEKQI